MCPIIADVLQFRLPSIALCGRIVGIYPANSKPLCSVLDVVPCSLHTTVVAMASSLRKCTSRFWREVALLRQLFRHGLRSDSFAQGIWYDAGPVAEQSYAIIRVHDAWSRFCRTLVLTSATGGVWTVRNRYLLPAPGVGKKGDPLATLKSTYPARIQRQTQWEPKWYFPDQTIEASERLRIENRASVSAALGSVGNSVNDLRLCRNYLAHRSLGSNREVDTVRRRLSVPPGWRWKSWRQW